MTNKKAKGIRAKTRDKLKNKSGKTSVNKLLAELPVGGNVQIIIDSSRHEGMPHHRYHGLSGTISGRKGRAYVIAVNKGNNRKSVVTTPAHLKVISSKVR